LLNTFTKHEVMPNKEKRGKQRHDHYYSNSHLTNCFANEITNSVVFATSDLKSLPAANSFALEIQQRTDDSAQTLTFIRYTHTHVYIRPENERKYNDAQQEEPRRRINRLTGLETHLKSNVLMKS
jgi:hypothetical protein